jgi:hypothetical protein
VGLPIMNLLAKLQVTAEIEYVEDTPMFSNELQVGHEELTTALCIRYSLRLGGKYCCKFEFDSSLGYRCWPYTNRQVL